MSFSTPLSLSTVNELGAGEFVSVIGPIFEHSPWIAARSWPLRPFASRSSLLNAMNGVVRESSPDEQLSLINAHPDLAGRLARLRQLTTASTQEQAGAGLDSLTPSEAGEFETNNQQYREKFGFPFIICARMHSKDEILRQFRERTGNTREMEISNALREIGLIARLRLEDLVAP